MKITDKETIERYYQALIDKDNAFIGIFYAAIKTTHIFCLATCHAKKPKRENVEFYTALKEVLNHGYRPCKLCKPTENTTQIPKQVQEATALVQENLKDKILDSDLKKRGISPEIVRRWFKNNYGITFHTYQRMYRINNAFIELKNGKTAVDTAFETGYESLSGFGYTYKKLMGKSPKQSIQKKLLLIDRFVTPLGPMFVCADDDALCLLEFVDRRMLETELKDLQRLFQAQIIVGENKHIRQTKKEIAEYFQGARQRFNVKLRTAGSEFQKQVWQKLLEIPYGTTRSYQNQAAILNKPKAVRAVGNANGANRISIIIPCHRVIGKNGNLTGYGGGLERKEWLLKHEKNTQILKSKN